MRFGTFLAAKVTDGASPTSQSVPSASSGEGDSGDRQHLFCGFYAADCNSVLQIQAVALSLLRICAFCIALDGAVKSAGEAFMNSCYSMS